MHIVFRIRVFFPTSGVHTVPYFTGILRIQQDFFRCEPFNLHLQVPIIRPLHDLDSDSLLDLLDEMPLWVKTPDYDRVSTTKLDFCGM